MRMRGVVAWLVLAGLAILLTSGVALANNNINCSGGSCDGTAKDDTMHGTATPDEMNADAGDDWAIGMGSHDSLYGQRGDDTLKGGHGADQLYGYYGDDKLVGGDGNDTINAHDDNHSTAGVEDVIDCGSGRDIVFFDKGFDKVLDNCEVKKPISG